MLSRILMSALSCALLLSTATTALPSATHCRCTITSADASPSPPSAYRDSLENPDTLIPMTPTPPDLCTALGPSLENHRHTNSALHESYISKTDQRAIVDATSEEKPISTTILLRLAASQDFQNLGIALPGTPSERDRPRERIECRTVESDVEAWSSYQVSWMTLVVLHVVVVLVVVVCVVEGVMLLMRWMSDRAANTVIAIPAPHSTHSTLRLNGEEKRLVAHPPVDRTYMHSPGVEKKLRLYASPSWKAQQYSYIEDEDDEFNRPVM